MQVLYDKPPAPRAKRRNPKETNRKALYQCAYRSNGPTTLGFELELECPRPRRDWNEYDAVSLGEALWKPLKSLGVQVAYDGSLKYGYEVQTPPATLSAWKKLEPGIRRQLQAAELARHRASRSCGLHVHVSRSAFGESTHVETLVTFMQRSRRQIVQLAGRSTYFAAFAGGAYDLQEWKQEAQDWASRSLVRIGFAEKYRAVSFTHVNTAEFRIFSSTTDWKTIRRSLEFVDAVVAFTKQAPPNPDWTTFKRWVRKEKTTYRVLANYLRKESHVRDGVSRTQVAAAA